MRGFLSPWHILICSSRASDGSYFRLLCFFFRHRRKPCHFDSQRSSTCHYVVGRSWLFNRYPTVYHHWTVNLVLSRSCQVWNVKVLLLLSGHVWPPGAVEGQKNKHKAWLNAAESWLLGQEIFFRLAFALRKSGAKAAQKPVALSVCCHKWAFLPGLFLPSHLWKILLLWHKGPLYPGAQSHAPSSGEQDPPFSQLQEMEQFGPQRPWVQILSQWMPKDKKEHVRFHTAYSALWSKKCLAGLITHSTSQSKQGSRERNSCPFISPIKWKLRKCQRGEFCRC